MRYEFYDVVMPRPVWSNCIIIFFRIYFTRKQDVVLDLWRMSVFTLSRLYLGYICLKVQISLLVEQRPQRTPYMH